MGSELPLSAHLEGVARGESKLLHDGLLKWEDDMDIQGSWSTSMPGREKNVGWS